MDCRCGLLLGVGLCQRRVQHGADFEALLVAQVAGKELPVVANEDTKEWRIGAFNESCHCSFLLGNIKEQWLLQG